MKTQSFVSLSPLLPASYICIIIIITMKSVIAASLIASAAAFGPASQQSSARTSVATNMAFEKELGVQAPLGFFDPLGMVSGTYVRSIDRSFRFSQQNEAFFL